MKKLPIGTQDFETLRNLNQLYIDKTSIIFELINRNRYYFFARPRRFGKSLMLSVIKNLYLGKKELFKGLFIYNKHDFQQYPVVYLSFASYSKNKDLKEYIKNNAIVFLNNQEIKIKDFEFFDLGLIIEEIKQQTKYPVVFLIDEYDKPVLVHLNDINKAEEIRNFFCDFYTPIKDKDSNIHFFFLTGLTKLMKMNIFSVLNNLDDISFDETFSDLVGFTQDELETNFCDELQIIANNYKIDYDQLIDFIKKDYNGYNFGANHLLYNPWDIINFIQKRKFGYYWADTGIPGSISDFITEKTVDVKRIIENERKNKLAIDDIDLRVHNLNNLKLEVLFFYSGYLTIKNITRNQNYYLKFPNKETEIIMMKYFLGLSLKNNYNIDEWRSISNNLIQGIISHKEELYP